jgi:hypothetical protein
MVVSKHNGVMVRVEEIPKAVIGKESIKDVGRNQQNDVAEQNYFESCGLFHYQSFKLVIDK